MQRILLLTLLVLLSTQSVFAQAERHELGRRMKLLEETWNTTPDEKLRSAALKTLTPVTRQFLSFQFGEAARTLDTAREQLGPESTPTQRWLQTLYAEPNSWLLDASDTQLSLTVKSFYKPIGERPEELRVSVDGTGVKPMSQILDKLPAQLAVTLDATKKDQQLTLTVTFSSKKESTSYGISLHRIADRDKRFADLKAAVNNAKPSVESATVKDRLSQFQQLARGATLETDLPVLRLLREAEEVVRLGVDKPYFTQDRPGEHWLTVPTGTNSLTACRILVPGHPNDTTKRPVVVALHGAGGSENLFFEGYGAGQIVKESARRGWILIAPRSGLNFGLGGPPPIPELLDELAERFPIDPEQVYLLGHSMGASQTTALLQKAPSRFRAAAMLGGGGSVRKGADLKEKPVMITVGEQDFALSGARSLKKALETLDASVKYREYPQVEHMMIVRIALPDIFEFFDTLKKPAK